MSEKKIAGRDKPKQAPPKPRVVKIKLPRDVQVLEDGTIVRRIQP